MSQLTVSAGVAPRGPAASRMMVHGEVRPAAPKAAATFCKVVALLILAVTTLGPVHPGLVSLLLKVLGAMLIVGLVHLLSRRAEMPAEVRLYFAWLAWSLVTAILVAVDPALSFRHGWTVFQIGLVLWAVVVAHIRRPDIGVVMYGFWGLGLLFAFVTVLNPDLLFVVKEGSQRLQVLENNPNSVAEVWVFAILAALYLGQRVRLPMSRIMILGSIAPMSMLILFTASRKMLIAEVLVFAVWGLSVPRVGTRRRSTWLPLPLIVAGAAAVYLSISVWEKSPMSRRWEALRASETMSGHLAGRDGLYIEGLTLLVQHPVAGVGLANQRALRRGMFFHSDYVDVLASTGLVGALLYFSMYLRAIRRGRAVRLRRSGLSRLDWRAFQTYIVLLVWLMAGFLRYTDFYSLVLLGAFVGDFIALEKRKTIGSACPSIRN